VGGLVGGLLVLVGFGLWCLGLDGLGVLGCFGFGLLDGLVRLRLRVRLLGFGVGRHLGLGFGCRRCFGFGLLDGLRLRFGLRLRGLGRFGLGLGGRSRFGFRRGFRFGGRFGLSDGYRLGGRLLVGLRLGRGLDDRLGIGRFSDRRGLGRRVGVRA